MNYVRIEVGSNGDKIYFLNDGSNRIHREDGPAVEYSDGRKWYYLNGKQIDPEIYSRFVKLKVLW